MFCLSILLRFVSRRTRGCEETIGFDDEAKNSKKGTEKEFGEEKKSTRDLSMNSSNLNIEPRTI